MKETNESKKDLMKEYYGKDECFNHQCVSCGSRLDEESYNGHVNYETWMYGLHMGSYTLSGNDENRSETSLTNVWSKRAKQIYENANPSDYSEKLKKYLFSKYETAYLQLMKELKKECDNVIYDVLDKLQSNKFAESVILGFTSASIKEIDFRDIAKGILSGCEIHETDPIKLKENKESDQYWIKRRSNFPKRPQRSGLDHD